MENDIEKKEDFILLIAENSILLFKIDFERAFWIFKKYSIFSETEMMNLFQTDENLIMEYFDKVMELIADNKNIQMFYLEKLCKEKKTDQVVYVYKQIHSLL